MPERETAYGFYKQTSGSQFVIHIIITIFVFNAIKTFVGLLEGRKCFI